MKSYLLAIFSVLTFVTNSQSLVNQWDFTYGGSYIDVIEDLITTCDGGFLLAGTTASPADCTITQPNRGDTDYWITKLNQNGEYEWDKRFGGDKIEELLRVINSNDGGYILYGISYSSSSPDKTDNNFDATLNTADIWVIKIDSIGNKIWDKIYGGISNEDGFAICSAWDGGYIIGFVSTSPVSGNITIPMDPLGDCCFMHIDENGNILWQKAFGGNNSDNPLSVTRNALGGYLLAMNSFSNASGNKSENNFDPTLLTPDYWVMKIDNYGNKIWDKTIGGNFSESIGSIVSLNNGDIFVSGYSWSPGISGNKTSPNHSSDTDYWLVKLDNSGTKLWDKTYGTNSADDGYCRCILTSDEKIIITGNSFSTSANGDKTQPNLANQQTWIICVDQNGNKIWDKTILQASILTGYAHPDAGTIETIDHCYVTANFTDAGIGGDKTTTAKGSFDFFILKYCDIDLVNNVPIDPCLNFGLEITYPNIFTPNNDGHNDVLVFQNLPEQSSLSIYNRWGNLVYSKDNYANDWRAEDVSDGVCFYILKLPTGGTKHGTIQIIR